MKKVLSLGEIITMYFLHSSVQLAIAYRKHIASQKADKASTVTTHEKGGQDGK